MIEFNVLLYIFKILLINVLIFLHITLRILEKLLNKIVINIIKIINYKL
jgi:hypothetical protein